MQRFRDFFDELRDMLVEREDVLAQCELALLCRQHVLMTGPPGTAKSQLASLVLGRILDEDTGQPSLFARQFTESTVQTDLIGPLDFKTLMETGRTEHFTDEGILGSVHAFLDEVFDGRDMLLRSTLNLLHERELKQGGETARGHIESAFMTSNRYISEILETSRETMLAFVDRISFISFVPRGFARPGNLDLVVRRHGGGFGRHVPKAALTVQDLDVLQRAAEMTYVPAQICDAVAMLVRLLDEELAAAQRADPAFLPTRYLSTRTAVQAARVLRAVAVRDKIFSRPDRGLEVGYDDLAGLRYNLVLAGLDRDAVAARMERETDPRERRQLDIMRTEMEIFARCLAKLPRPKSLDAPPTVPLAELRAVVDTARTSGESGDALTAVRRLVAAAESGARGSDTAGRLLVEAVAILAEHALRAGLAPTAAVRADLASLTTELVTAADDLERAGSDTRPMAQWLRGRLFQIVDESLVLAPLSHASVEVLLADAGEEPLEAQVDARVSAMEQVHELRAALDAGGALRDDATAGDDAWTRALEKLDGEIALLMDAAFRLVATKLLAGDAGRPLAAVLRELEPFIDRVSALVERIERLGGNSQLRQRVMGPRLEPFIERAFHRIDASDRRKVVGTVESVVAELDRVGLGQVVTAQRLATWLLGPLARDEAARAEAVAPVASAEDFARARDREAAFSLAATLMQVAIVALPSDASPPSQPALATRAVHDSLRGLDEAVIEQIVAADLARASRAIASFETWWEALRGADATADETVARLEQVVQSGFLREIRGSASLELALELKQLVEVFPSAATRVHALRERLAQLDSSSNQFLVDLLERRSDGAWREALEPKA